MYYNRKKGKDLIIGLDHNLDLLKSHIHSLTQEFVDINVNRKLWPVITKPTRITHTTATLIDNIIVSERIFTNYTSGIILEDLSNHLPCYITLPNLKLDRKKNCVITSRKLTQKT